MSDALSMPVAGAPAAGLWTVLKEDLSCVFQRDPAARSKLEVLATYPGVHALLAHRLSHRLWRSGWRFTARLLAFVGRTHVGDFRTVALCISLIRQQSRSSIGGRGRKERKEAPEHEEDQCDGPTCAHDRQNTFEFGPCRARMILVSEV